MKEYNLQIWALVLLKALSLLLMFPHQDTTISYSKVSCVLCKTEHHFLGEYFYAESTVNTNGKAVHWGCLNKYVLKWSHNWKQTSIHIYICNFSFRIWVGPCLKCSVWGRMGGTNKQKKENRGKKAQSFSLWKTPNWFSSPLSCQHIVCKNVWQK